MGAAIGREALALRLHSTVLAVGAAVAVLATASAAGPRQPFTLADLARVVTILTPQISPSGRYGVAVISRIDSEHNRTNDEIDLINLTSGARRALTHERTGVASPKWSPDGRRIAFIAGSGPGASARAQIFVMPLDGGDAMRVTSAREGVDEFAWRPDGRALAYVAVDPPRKERGSQRFVDAYEAGNGSYLLRGAARSRRLWLQPLDGAMARLLTPGRGSVTNVANREATSPLSFSPDGSRLAYAWAPNALHNDADHATVRIVDVATGSIRPLTANKGRERDPLFSPDGKRVAYLHAEGDTQTHPLDVFVASQNGGEAANVSRAVDQYVHDAAWQPAGDALYFTSTTGTQSVIWRSSAGAKPIRVEIGGLSTSTPLAGAIANDGTLLYVASTTHEPPELYVSAPGAASRKISAYNGVIASRALGTSERVTYPSPVGITADAVLTKPPGFDSRRKYPLVLIIHGGPTYAAPRDFYDLAQLMAARGWLVLEPNYRGSNNLGHTYLAAIFDDISTGPGRDIMAAVAAVRARGIVDPARIAVSGCSYGGVMTTWLIGHYHIWKAAVAGAAVTDWIADYALTDHLNADLYLFRGSPFVARYRARWVHEQSITYVADVTTPVLLFADRGDARVPNVSSYEFFHALRDLGKPVQFIVYPVDGHVPDDPARTADIYARWMNYIGEHFKQ